VYVGRIAAVVDDEDDQAVGPDDAQCEDQDEHRLDGLRNPYVGDEIVAGVARMRAAGVLHGGCYQERASL